MRLAPLLIKYLTENKTLRLPGLGIFHADSTYDPDVDYSKKGTSLLNISFEQATVTAFDSELIDFISQQTGKMRVLAESDLASELDAIITFLNTGKPYYIEGIGTITKRLDGTFEFHQAKHQHNERKKNIPITERHYIPQAYIDETRKTRNKKPAIVIVILCLLAVAATVWFYLKSTEESRSNLEEASFNGKNTGDEVVTILPSQDSLVQSSTPAVATSQGYRFILEVAQEPRASKRYNQLKSLNWPVNIETKDSVNYKLYIEYQDTHIDTTRIKDSLSVLSGKKVWIE